MIDQLLTGWIHSPQALENGLKILVREFAVTTPLQSCGLGSPQAAKRRAGCGKRSRTHRSGMNEQPP